MTPQSQYDDEFFKIAASLDIKQPRRVPGRYTWLASALVMSATLAVVLLGAIIGGPMIVVAVVAFGAGTLLAAKLFPARGTAAGRPAIQQSEGYDLSRDDN